MPVKKKVVKQQEKQKMVDFRTAVKRFWTNYTNFDGVAQRSEYWFAVLFLFVADLLLDLLGMALPLMGFLYWLWCLVIFIPCLSLGARRLHDAGFTAKWLLYFWGTICLGFLLLCMGYFSLLFVLLAEAAWVIAGGIGIFLLVVSFLPSKLKNNPYRK